MGGAIVVLVLAGLLVPISMLLLAVVFDAFVVAWALFRVIHDDWSPRIRSAFHHVHFPHLIASGHR